MRPSSPFSSMLKLQEIQDDFFKQSPSPMLHWRPDMVSTSTPHPNFDFNSMSLNGSPMSNSLYLSPSTSSTGGLSLSPDILDSDSSSASYLDQSGRPIYSHQQYCLPMSHILPPPPASPTPSPMSVPSSMMKRRSPSPTPSMSPSPAPAPPPKKQRAAPSGPISTKDFVPPDVTGLSKREARLVKNRAAAFLSRQRKREEFELMEKRVQELEKENSHLLRSLNQLQSLSSTLSSSSKSKLGASSANSEVAELKSLLLAAAARESALKKEVDELKSSSSRSQSSSPSPSPIPSSKKTGSGVALMTVLLISLSLLSPTTTTTPAANMPLPAPFSFSANPSSLDFSLDNIIGSSGHSNPTMDWRFDDQDCADLASYTGSGALDASFPLWSTTSNSGPFSRLSSSSASPSLSSSSLSDGKKVGMSVSIKPTPSSFGQDGKNEYDFEVSIPSPAGDKMRRISISLRRPSSSYAQSNENGNKKMRLAIKSIPTSSDPASPSTSSAFLSSNTEEWDADDAGEDEGDENGRWEVEFKEVL